MPFERDARTLPLDRRCAVANVAAAVAFGGRGREQHLLAADAAHQQLMPGAAAAVPRQASHLGLVHRVDHRRRGAGAAERVTDVGNLGDAGALAAEFARHGDAQKPLGRAQPRSPPPGTATRNRPPRRARPRPPQPSRRGTQGFRALTRASGSPATSSRAPGRAKRGCLAASLFATSWMRFASIRNRTSIAILRPEVTQNFEFVLAIG